MARGWALLPVHITAKSLIHKSDTIDARKLAELLRAGLLSPVYHGQNGSAAMKHLGRSYSALTEDTTRVMGRLKALYRSQAIACAGQKPYASRHREQWLVQLTESGLQRRARRLIGRLVVTLSIKAR